MLLGDALSLTPEELGPSATYYGWGVAGPGDLDGDGYGEVAVGAGYLGVTRVYPGGPDGVDPANVVTLTPASYGTAGKSIAGPGDLDGDGYRDLVLSDPQNADLWIYAGGAGGVSDAVHGVVDGCLLLSVVSTGDVDGDGVPDFGSEASCDGGSGLWVFLAGGSAGVLVPNTSVGEPDTTYAYEGYGGLPTPAGDLDGDGLGDLIAVAVEPDGTTHFDTSSGGADPFAEPVRIDLAADVSTCPEVNGAGVGDLDGDGFGDALFVQVPQCGDVSTAVYQLSTWYGSASGLDPGGAQARDLPYGATSALGSALGAVGDMDGDGRDDALIGDQWAATVAVDFGGPEEARLMLESPTVSFDTQFGAFAAGVPDVNGDGWDEVVVGAHLADNGVGEAWLFYGGCRDFDGDGACSDTDCDDEDGATYPGADDTRCDGVDRDCDGAGGPEDDEDGDGRDWTTETAEGTDPCLVDEAPKGEDSGAVTESGGCACQSGVPSFASLGLLALAALGCVRRRHP